MPLSDGSVALNFTKMPSVTAHDGLGLWDERGFWQSLWLDLRGGIGGVRFMVGMAGWALGPEFGWRCPHYGE